MGRSCVLLVCLLLFCSCSETDPPGSNREIEVSLRTARTPRVGESVAIICEYMIVYPTDSVRTWHPRGRIFFSTYDWKYVSGDTIWTDTLRTFVHARHEIVLRPVRHDLLGLDAELIAPPEGSFIDPLAGRAALLVHSRLKWP